jgi:hypothetical protein
VDWIGLAKDRNMWRALVNSVLNLRVPWNAGKQSSGLASSDLSISVQLHIVSYALWSALMWNPLYDWYIMVFMVLSHQYKDRINFFVRSCSIKFALATYSSAEFRSLSIELL